MVAEGMRNRAIASHLYISYHTTMTHMGNIMSKLRVSNRTEAGMVFLRSRNRVLSPSAEMQE
jgi:NarL family two-component system response regulator LiaR